MNQVRLLFCAALALTVGLLGDVSFDATDTGRMAAVSLIGPAAQAAPRHAARRTARRTSRRTTRRVTRRTSVAGCPLRRGYYYCGGVYYRPVVDGGRTVYVVVNP